MKEWPLDLFLAGTVLCFAGAMLNGYFTCSFTVVGYIMGFAFASNMPKVSIWLVWLCVFAGGAVLGIVLDVIMKLRGKKDTRK